MNSRSTIIVRCRHNWGRSILLDGIAETREMVEGSVGAAGEEGESKSRQSLEILLKEVEVTEPAGDSTEPTKTKPPEEEDDDEVGKASEAKETATVKVVVTVKQSVEEAMAKGAAVEKDEANNADVATLEKTMETGATMETGEFSCCSGKPS